MANINWDSQELESTAAQVNTLLQNYDKTMDEIQQTLNTMEFRLKLRTDVDNDLSKLKRRVSQERSKMQQVSSRQQNYRPEWKTYRLYQ